MSANNIKCLLCCARVITSSEIISLSQLRESSLLYKIIDPASEGCDFLEFIKEIKGFFNDKLSCDFEDNDHGLSKILLLSIVVHILRSNDNNKKTILTELCNKIPLNLHKNACSMFAPIIMRYSDSENITDVDLEQCLNENNKENEMSYFSPIKVNEKSKYNHTFASHKQKIHQSIKASRNYEPFPTSVDDFDTSDTEESSSLVKLVNYVQSPDYQTKKLMKSNRDLGKNVNELEYKLYMTSTFEVELGKTLTHWKDKCKSLENKLKDMQYMVEAKEEEVLEKNSKINELSEVLLNNKRLEEKIKDYQDQIEILKSINDQYDTTLEENKKLKIENHNMGHYYSLAKQRRIEIENLLKEIEFERNKNIEFNTTKDRLSKTEEQLMELQNQLHNMNKSNSGDTLPDFSFNSSFYNPEPMSIVVEKEKIDLQNELAQLKEVFVHKDIHESVVKNLNNELCCVKNELTNASKQITYMTTEMSDLTTFCDHMNENKPWDIPTMDRVCKVKDLFDKIGSQILQLNESITQLSSENNDLLQSRNGQKESMLQQGCQIKYLESKVRQYENGCRNIFDSLNIGENINVEDFANVIMQELSSKNNSLCQSESSLRDYRERLHSINNILSPLCQDLCVLKNQVQKNKIDYSIYFNEMLNEFSLFKKTFNLDELKRQYEKIMSDSVTLEKVNQGNELKIKCLKKKLEDTVSSYTNKLILFKGNEEKKHKIEIEQLKIILEKEYDEKSQILKDKYTAEEKESKHDMMKLIDDYQSCLRKIEIMTMEYEQNIKSKEDIISREGKRFKDTIKETHEKEKEILNMKNILEEKTGKIIIVEEEVISLKKLSEGRCRALEERCRALEERCRALEDRINELQNETDQMKHEENLIKVRYDELHSLYNSSKLLVQEIQLKNEMELTAINEKIHEKENDLIILESKLLEEQSKMKEILSERFLADNEVEELRHKEVNYINEICVKKEKISTLEIKLDNFSKTIEHLQLINLDNEKLSTEFKDLEKETLRKKNEIDELLLKEKSLEEEVRSCRLLLNDSLSKVLLLDGNIVLKVKKLEYLQSSVESNDKEIKLLKTILQERDDAITVQEKDIELKICHIKSIEDENDEKEKNILNLKKILEEKSGKIVIVEEEIISLKKLTEEKRRALEERINELQNETDQRKHNEDLVKVRYDELQILYNSSKSLVQEMKTQIEDERLKNEIELSKINEKIIKKENDLIIHKSKLLEEQTKTKNILSERLVIDNEVKELRLREVNYISEIFVKDEKISTLEIKLDNFSKTIENLKFKCSKNNFDNERLSTEFKELETEALQKKNEIDELLLKEKSLEEEVRSGRLLLNDSLSKVLLLEASNGLKDKKFEDLQSSVESNDKEIKSLKAILQERDDAFTVQEKDIELKICHIKSIEDENENSLHRIHEMNDLIKELEETNQLKNLKITSVTSENKSLKESLNEYSQTNILLKEQINELLKDEQRKEQEIKNAETSITKFNLLIKSLESTIESEMHNYEKMSDEYKHAEELSVNYMNKYNSIVKERNDEVKEYQKTIEKLTNSIHRIEEERDDQIHEMERLFNSEIFDLQQRLEESATELNSMKDETMESRKTHKATRLHLEEEIDRLQKALQTRENQFNDEKTTLKSVIEKERDDKQKLKDGYENEIERLEDQIKCLEEKSVEKLNESHSKFGIFEAKVNELQVINSRLTRVIKEKDTKYHKEISSLQHRITELEPLEQEMIEVEERMHQLMSKLTQLEGSDNVQELKQLRLINKSQADYVTSLEKSIDNFNLEKVKMEQHIKTLMFDCENLTDVKNKLKEAINNVKEQLQSSESKSQSRLMKIDNYEREIKTLTNDNEALKKRYLKLREINEKHKIEIEKDHQSAVDNYIARIEALTNDVATFQEQMHSLTKEKNLLIEKNYSSKRTIDEQTSKLDGLQKLVWNHTENERKQMLATYDENSRYTRMSHWADVPHTSRQLPPVSRISESMGLNSIARSRFESFIYSPYSCEDECGISMSKELPLPPLPPRKHTSTIHDACSTPISTPTRVKKAKEGIRLQLTNKIRRSLHLDPETPKAHKTETAVFEKTTMLKSEMSTSSKVSSTSSSKPPLPKKNFFSSIKSHLKSDQVDIVNTDSVYKKDKKRQTLTSVDGGNKNVQSSTNSEYSLFTQDCEADNSETKISTTKINLSESGESNFSQSAKTPKPHSVINKLIRRSKNLSPKRKHTSDNLS